MDDLIALAERCEAATGADREIDALIWCALNGKKYAGHCPAYGSFGSENPETQVEFTEPPKRTRMASVGRPHLPHAKPWTASLDAAMTLVPEGWGFKADCGLGDSNSFTVGHVGPDKMYDMPEGWAQASTPALALTAASLRARAAALKLEG